MGSMYTQFMSWPSLGNSKPATVVKSENAGSLFERVEETVKSSEAKQQQSSQTPADNSSSGCDGEKKTGCDDKIVISELDDSTGEQ